MDVSKIKGILDAIEVESKQPQPSHANLARLTAMALNEVLNFLDLLCKGIMPLLLKPAPEPTAQKTDDPVTVHAPEPEAPVEAPEIKAPEAEG